MKKNKSLKSQTGASLVEYSLLTALIAFAALIALHSTGDRIQGNFTQVAMVLDGMATEDGGGTDGSGLVPGNDEQGQQSMPAPN